MRATSFKTTIHLLSGLALLAGSAGLAGPAAFAAPAGLVEVPASIVAKDVPEIPAAAAEELLPYENIRTALFSDWHPSERRLLIRTRFAESVQLHEVGAPLGARSQLTFHREPVTNGQYRPGRPEQLLYTLNEGGAENFQFFLLDRKTGKTRRVSDGEHRFIAPLFSPSGKLLTYGSNARNGRDFDVYVADPDRPESARLLAQVSGQWVPLSWSRDESKLLLGELLSINESHLHQIDVATGKLAAVTQRPAQGETTVSYQGAEWSADGKAVYTVTDRDSEFLRLVRLDPATGAATVLSAGLEWDVEGFDLSDDGALIAFSVNEDGFSRLHVLETATGKERPVPELPRGVANGINFRPGSHEVGFILSWARSPSDVYSLDADSGRLERWTESEVGGLDAASFVEPRLVRFPSFDGRSIPAYVYPPDPGKFPGKRPVFLSIHGGPEGQARPNFQGSNNYLPGELGVALIYPNVRGSSGYGKTYLKLDNGMLREDSVKDIGALLDWVAAQPDLDASRVMVGGGSYGGYMVLASLVHYSDRLCCGYDIVGVSNFVTFLENTQEYRRDLRRVEYGDERDPKMRAFLESIAPARQADRIQRPLLVAQGANDPRVPLSESDQMVAAVAKSGVPVWYVVAKDEGHGFQKKSNSDYLRTVLFEFIRRHLVK